VKTGLSYTLFSKRDEVQWHLLSLLKGMVI